MKATESLELTLTPAEFDHVVGELAKGPTGAIFATFLERLGAVLVVVQVDGEVTGYLLTPAADAAEGREIGTAIAERLAAAYAAGRDADAATELLLRRLTH